MYKGSYFDRKSLFSEILKESLNPRVPQAFSNVKDDFEVINQFILFQVI